jgi:Mn-dependent DtxR family transcriptional regulator
VVGHFQEFEDEYLEMMYEFHEQHPHARVRTGDLAAKLGVKPASATEMVQRLAARGYLEYVPYKGAKLTADGLVHGQQMKRRHRLAEVLLDLLPYDGNPHETACRLEHAIDDDLEVALSTMLSGQTTDPSGRPIPAPSERIQARLNAVASIEPLASAHASGQYTVRLMLLPGQVTEWLAQQGIGIQSVLTLDNSIWFTETQMVLNLDDAWVNGILVERVRP